MNVKEIIDKYYPCENELKNIYMIHAGAVADFALGLARRHPELCLDEEFIYEAAMLHDIGIFMTDAPRIYCFGNEQYLCHVTLAASYCASLDTTAMQECVRGTQERDLPKRSLSKMVGIFR